MRAQPELDGWRVSVINDTRAHALDASFSRRALQQALQVPAPLPVPGCRVIVDAWVYAV